MGANSFIETAEALKHGEDLKNRNRYKIQGQGVTIK